MKGLALQGAKVYLGARSEHKAMEAIRCLYAEDKQLKAEQIVWLPIDLGDPRSVIRAAEIVVSKESHLDILGNTTPWFYM